MCKHDTGKYVTLFENTFLSVAADKEVHQGLERDFAGVVVSALSCFTAGLRVLVWASEKRVYIFC